MQGIKKVNVILVYVGKLGTTSTGFREFLAEIRIEMKVEHTQKKNLTGNSKDFETGTLMPHKYHYCCVTLCEPFVNRLLLLSQNQADELATEWVLNN